MKAKTKFMKMYYKLPNNAKTKFIYDSYGKCPMSIAIVFLEVMNDTELGKEALKDLGYEDS